MDRAKNPYAPGAGLQPPELAGRDSLIAEALIDMERVLNGRSTKSLMLLGLRGVGKTVLLNRLFREAEKKGFQTAKIEAPEGGKLPELLVPALRRIVYELDLMKAADRRVRQAVTILRNFAAAFKVSIGDTEFGVEPAPGRADTGDLEHDLAEMLIAVTEAAAHKQTAIGLFIDEVQYLSAKELAALVVACHEIAQRGLPFLFIGAGLPQIAALAGNAKSYAERLFNYPEVGRLDDAAARQALVRPAEQEGADYHDDAIIEILRLTNSYPYFIQEWGFHVWNAAPTPEIMKQDVVSATPHIIAHLDANFFRVRFDRMTALQQKYLRAMAEIGVGPHKTGDIAAILEVDAAAVATTRQQLIDKGMVWSQRHGETAFTVPLFDEFMLRQIPLLEPHIPRRRRSA
ncbi:MAG: ATP-binding protein [Sphingomonadaceae bacterium]